MGTCRALYGPSRCSENLSPFIAGRPEMPGSRRGPVFSFVGFYRQDTLVRPAACDPNASLALVGGANEMKIVVNFVALLFAAFSIISCSDEVLITNVERYYTEQGSPRNVRSISISGYFFSDPNGAVLCNDSSCRYMIDISIEGMRADCATRIEGQRVAVYGSVVNRAVSEVELIIFADDTLACQRPN